MLKEGISLRATGLNSLQILRSAPPNSKRGPKRLA
jgi:hypothetical protein